MILLVEPPPVISTTFHDHYLCGARSTNAPATACVLDRGCMLVMMFRSRDNARALLD
jgi:hypothetical protein